MTTQYAKPLPRVHDLNRAFFLGALDGRLVLQHCDDCGHVWFPSARSCPKCLSKEITWKPVSGRGRLWSWVVMHQRYIPAFADDLPYAVAFVELEEGPFMMTSIVGAEPEDLVCDMPVEVVFDQVTDEVALPRFRPVDGTES
ncbi:Zn-ribbon domain-containing OB-fold protein [Streptomyces sp. NPDC057253]|uniref:Zn-ribbon domain-containing OB-fold protein n=1 Tax=Streptomyces sp. NPDC057253 TaxID=3346069 RepID=UPI003638246B